MIHLVDHLRSSSVFRVGAAGRNVALGYLGLMAVVALLAPVLATDRPLLSKTAEGWTSPALANAIGEHTNRSPGHNRLADEFILSAPVVFGPDSIDLRSRLTSPGRRHWFGTDELGRDVLSRVIHGSRVSLVVGLTAAVLSLSIGTLFGAVAGYYGGVYDWCISRLIELVVCFPFLFLVLAIVAIFPPSMLTIVMAVGLTSWTTEARLVRGEFLKVREMEFAQAARASGASDLRIMSRHLLPNAITPVIVLAAFGVGSAILVESALSFLGLGIPLPASSWGSILSSADDYLGHAWWLAVFPGLAIFTTVAACNVVGESVRAQMSRIRRRL